jgi:hypothetical protein
MTDTIEPTTTPTPATPSRRLFTHRAWWAGAAGGAAVLITYLLLANATFTMHGTYTSGTRTSDWTISDPCYYYTAPTRGSNVTITDHNGTVVGYGTLDDGMSVPGYRCEYGFTVEHVPYWGAPYSVTVQGVKPVAFDSGEAATPDVITP